MTRSPEREHLSAAIQLMVKGVTTPLLYELPKGLALLGNGTFFKVEDRYFIVTAKHIFDPLEDGTKVDPGKVSVPNTPDGPTLLTLGSYNLHLPDQDVVDIAILELPKAGIVARLQDRWTFLTLDQVGSPSKDGTFFLAGYPASMMTPRGKDVGGSLVTVFTEMLAEVPSDARQPVVPGLDLFFYYGKSGERGDGSVAATPELPGTSGTSVWEVSARTSSPIWSPRTACWIVGVQSAYQHGKYMRVKSWSVVAQAFKKIDPVLAELVEKAIWSPASRT